MKKKQKIQLSQILFIVFCVLIGGVCGLMIGRLMASTELSFLPLYLLLLVTVFVSIYLHIIAHEAGHLLCGLLSGYRFCSFRIGSLTLVRDGDGCHFRKHSLAGTAGQCLMAPPELVDGRIPYVLYNLGGSLANLLLSAILALLSLIVPPLAAVLLRSAALLGLALGLGNGIPMQAGSMPNDGHNARSLGKDPAALRAFWIQMKINEELTYGKRIRDLPADWFEMPAKLDNTIVATLAAYRCNRLLDERSFEAADALMASLADSDAALVGAHRHLLTIDRMYIELISQNRPEVLEAMQSKELAQFMKAMKTNIGVLRTQYAQALLAERDEVKAETLLMQFEKAVKASPYPGDAAAEQELIALVDERWEAMQ